MEIGNQRVMFFAYGILRGDKDAIATNATTYGILLEHPEINYPRALLNEEGTIYGDLYHKEIHSMEWAHICRMETGAGYVPTIVEVWVTPNGPPIQAIAWHSVYHNDDWEIQRSGIWSGMVAKEDA